ncbi:NUDIX domain-containing protein [Haloferula rosea]|uniref:NUDIX hydrolase n=1 Tax=Haloferula rosea TaxID=490093 RepID=A0A934VGM5_9BACT|nr:NUDIX domain-containing protein [Haloferula rosea]MBK1828197.1 NUDIX hydrolase [Haloferula rosea]
MSYTYEYPRPAVTVDAIVFSGECDSLKVLLIQRKHAPFAGDWALPGGFLDEDEDPYRAVERELEEETELTGLKFQPLGFWGHPGRDPRGHTVSLAFWTKIDAATVCPRAADDAAALDWFPVRYLPRLAFDHAEILRRAFRELD